MPKFKCSYAYDVPCYFDFTVEAQDEAAAKKLIKEALNKKVFQDVDIQPCFESGGDNERVFVSAQLAPDDDGDRHVLVHDNGDFSLVQSEP